MIIIRRTTIIKSKRNEILTGIIGRIKCDLGSFMESCKSLKT